MRPGGSSRPMIAAPVMRLAGAGLADHAEHLARLRCRRRRRRARPACRAASGIRRAGGTSSSGSVGRRPGHRHQRSFGFRASRSQSPSRLTDSTSSDQRDAGEDRDPPFAGEQEVVADADQRAERGLGRRHADAEEGQRRLGDDGDAEVERARSPAPGPARWAARGCTMIAQRVQADDARRLHVFLVASRPASSRARCAHSCTQPETPMAKITT